MSEEQWNCLDVVTKRMCWSPEGAVVFYGDDDCGMMRDVGKLSRDEAEKFCYLHGIEFMQDA